MDLVERLAVALGADDAEELGGGHQGRVFRVIGQLGHPVVAKVLDASLVDRAELEARLEVNVALADLDPRVCRPLLIGGRGVTELSSADDRLHYAVCYEFAGGIEPDPGRADDAVRMGAALSELHRSMSQLSAAPLPVVSALRAVSAEDVPAAGPHQLLHGDFSASNLRRDGDVVRIFDLDDCGYGPPAFDVANALHMVLFDTVTQGTRQTYETFRGSFIDGYVGGPGPSLPEGSLDRFIDLRVQALGSWLDDLDSAPIGIRTASSAWHRTLRSFVAAIDRSRADRHHPLGFERTNLRRER